MNYNSRRVLSLLLAVLMILSLLPMTAFAQDDAAATFRVGGTVYANLNEAIAAAEAGTDKTIVVASDGTLSGNYTIPKGVTLLVPFDDADTLYTETPKYDTSYTNQTVYRKLTLTSNASLEVNGAISVGSKYHASSTNFASTPTGAYGEISLMSGSKITINKEGRLYAWGYITGDGEVTAESGADVYEYFQIADWRGGSALMDMVGNDKRVFPFSQYYVQNIQASLTLKYGATEFALFGPYMKKYFITVDTPCLVEFIGTNGMFSLSEGSTVVKKYLPNEDRLQIDVNGDATMKNIAITLNVVGIEYTVDSKSYVLPINSNINICIHSGTTQINQDLVMLPGAQMKIDSGAEVAVADGNKVYLYDVAAWKTGAYVYAGGANYLVGIRFAPNKTKTRTVADLVDAKIDVNGTMMASGNVYTTTAGADICSTEGSGKYVQRGEVGTETVTYQALTATSFAEIPITPAKLHNADGSYTETTASKAGDTYVYANGKWAIEANEIAITFNPNGGTGSMDAMSVNPGVDNVLNANTFTREDYTFTGWNTKADGTGTAYADKATVNFDADTTLYAQWTQNPVITFDANDGEGTMSTQTVQSGVATALTANAFTRADYDFAGWNTAKDGTGTGYNDQVDITVTANTTLYAQWTLHKYHVRWLNWDGSVLQEGDYTCEDTAEWDMGNDDPSRPEDENYTYVFLNRWEPYDEANGINGWGFNPHADVDFTAVFNKFEKLTATFDANGGEGTMESVKIVNGESGEYYTLPECGFTREGYSFNGWLITGTVKRSTWGDEEDLNDELWTRTKLLALSDLTLKASWKRADGWVTDDQGKQYYKDGEIQKTGLTEIDGETYYLDPETGYAATGLVRTVKDDGDVNYYYFDEAGKAYKATDDTKEYVVAKNNGHKLPEGNNYRFDANGVIEHFDGCPNGIYYDEASDNYYYCVDGVIIANGLMKIGDSYYYAKTSTGAFVRNGSYWVTKTNGLLDEGIYTFDNEGKIVFPTDPEEPEVKNGIVSENGSLYYYVNGTLTGAGLIQIDGNYYYVKTSTGEVVHGRDYWITATNGLLAAGSYTFDETGKLIMEEPPEPPVETKNGIVSENGSLYYYVDGTLTGAGLIKSGDDYYYVKTSTGEVVHGRSYWITATNGLLPAGPYNFADDGKLIQQ